MSEVEQTQRRRTRERQKKKERMEKKRYKIRVRYKYHTYQTIRTEDYGTFEEMYNRYGDQYQYWCADLPPEHDDNFGSYSGYRLDAISNGSNDPKHKASCLKRYGKHKAWIDPQYKVNGKPVILVYNADSEWLTNTTTHRHYRRRMAADLNRKECICRGECIGNTDTPCPYPGYGKYGGYCRECYEAVEKRKTK